MRKTNIKRVELTPRVNYVYSAEQQDEPFNPDNVPVSSEGGPTQGKVIESFETQTFRTAGGTDIYVKGSSGNLRFALNSESKMQPLSRKSVRGLIQFLIDIEKKY